jgi:hypothetical protein
MIPLQEVLPSKFLVEASFLAEICDLFEGENLDFILNYDETS